VRFPVAALAALALLLAPSAATARVDTLSVRASLTHGIAGDERYVFVTEPGVGVAASGARVVALDRYTGAEVAAFPAPPGGFKLPFTLRVPRSGRLVVLDGGGFAGRMAQGATLPRTVSPRVYDYRYRTDRRGFHARLDRTTDFKGLPLTFAEDIEVLPNGEYVVSESIGGGLWLIGRDGEIRPGLVPDGAPLERLAPCPFADGGVGTVGGASFAARGGLAPGAGSLAVRGTQLYVSSTCQGGVQRLPIRVLLDDSRPAAERAKRIVTVTPRANALESLKGITFNRWDRDDPWIYAGDPFALQLIRIHSRSGRREVLSTDARLFNFTVATAFLPPRRRGGPNPLVTASDQEHRWSATNAALGGVDAFQRPFIVAEYWPR
jgi:hypothetical protein